MYTASAEFHEAVANGAPQKALLVFADAIFTNDDIDVDAGIELDDYFNTEEDLAIGQALSNELRFTLFNDARLLNDYEFGDFLATVGARISRETYTPSGTLQVITENATYVCVATSPYLTRDGAAMESQPDFIPVGMLAHDGKVYLFSDEGEYAVYSDADGSDITEQTSVIPFMQDKGSRMNGEGVYYNGTARTLDTWLRGVHEQYEFVPFGHFTAKRPNVPDVNQIMFTCHDFMTKFDQDMPSKTELNITYPVTFSALFVAMCDFVGVDYVTSTFINSTATITKEPEEFANATMREVLQWLAEAGAANLRFNRDGKLAFDWIRSTETVLDESNYVECNPYWYRTTQVNKLYNRNSESGTDKTVGTGDIGYLIQDNPLLKGVN